MPDLGRRSVEHDEEETSWNTGGQRVALVCIGGEGERGRMNKVI